MIRLLQQIGRLNALKKFGALALLAGLMGMSLMTAEKAHASVVTVDSDGTLEWYNQRKVVQNRFGFWVFWDNAGTVQGAFSTDGYNWNTTFDVFPGTATQG